MAFRGVRPGARLYAIVERSAGDEVVTQTGREGQNIDRKQLAADPTILAVCHESDRSSTYIERQILGQIPA